MKQGTKRVRDALCTAILTGLCAQHADAISITVDDASDSPGATGCTLRGALTAINAQAFAMTDACATSAVGTFGVSDTIQFAGALKNSVISLEQGQLSITGAVDVQGSGQTIDAGTKSTIAYMLSGFYQQYANFDVRLSNLTMTNSSSSTGTQQGAVTVAGPLTAHLDHVTLTNNTAQNSPAAALSAYSGATTILTNCSITGNTAFRAGFTAGAIFNDRSTLQIVNSTISGNQVFTPSASTLVAGAFLANRGKLEIIASTVAYNGVHGNVSLGGGAILSRSADLHIVNSTFAGNVAGGTSVIAGALLLMGSYDTTPVDILASTLANNTSNGSTTSAGGILLHRDGYTFNVSVENSILSHNSGVAPDVDVSNGAVVSQLSAQWDLLGTAAQPLVSGTGLVFSDSPGLSGLANNGGPTQTMALAPSSPALGAGNVALALYNGVPLLFDQRSGIFPRTFDNALDLGAFQTQGDRMFFASFEAGP